MDLNKTFQKIFVKKENSAVAQPEKPVEKKPSPVIRIEEKDARNLEFLRKKLEEYKGRFDPKVPAKEQLDTIYKIAIAEELLTKGEVNTWVVEKALADRYGISDRELFQNAREVIEDYLKTGGENVRKL